MSAGQHSLRALAARRLNVALTGGVLLCALLAAPAFASGGMIPPDAKAAIPLSAWCLTSATPTGGTWATKPTLFAFNGRSKLGEVTPGTCAAVNGYSARWTNIRLGCPKPGGGWVFSPAAEWVAKPGAACAVPAGQDFR